MRFPLVYKPASIRLFRAEVREFLRRGLALFLACAMPGTIIPPGARSGSYAARGSEPHKVPQVLLPPGGLNSLLKRPSAKASKSMGVENPASRATRETFLNVVRGIKGRARGASPSPAMPPSPPPNVSTIPFSFGGQNIAAGNYIWFTSVLTVGAIGSAPVTVFVRNASIQFTASGKTYSLPVPDGNLVFSSAITASTATTSYDSIQNHWTTYAHAGYVNPVFLSALAYQVPPGGLPGGINPVSWTASFCSDNASASLVWKWAGAVYTSFSSNYNSLGVKPLDVPTNQYNNSDPSGTPENYKSKVIAGATGNGKTTVGGYSGTSAVTTPCSMSNPPIANAGPGQTVALGSTVQLNGTGSTDPEGNPITYSWSFASKPAGSNAALSNPTSPTPTFVLDTYGSYTVQLIVSDSKSSSAPSTVIINTQNTAPVANAGPAQSQPTQTKVQLDGSKSTDVDGDPLTYQWSFVSVPAGSTATLSNPTIVNPTFITDKVGNFVVQLIVNDGHQNSAPSQVTITDSFVPPTANAGPNQPVEVESTVQLDGSKSTDLQGYPLTYNWSILSTPAGSTATLSDAHAVKPTFKADQLGTYVIQLVVNDGVANSSPSTVTISTNDVAPVANPGQAQTVTVGALVTLDGTQSTDSDGQPLTYSWSMLSKPNPSNSALVSPTSAKPSFRADFPGSYVIQLIVNDGFLSSLPVTVTISTNDVPPVANPGAPQTLTVPATVQLDGTGSTDSDSQPLTYRWAILSQPSGNNATLSSVTAAKPTFVANLAGTYVVQLIVNDGFMDSQPNTVTITANPPQPPTVSAGSDQAIVLPVNSVTLNGSASSTQPPNSPVTVQWTQVSGPGTVTFANPTQPVTLATFNSAGTYKVQLTGTVTATGLSASALATITVSLPPPPVANAGTNQSAIVNSTVQLDGTGSSDPSNLPLTYFWSFTSVPSGSAAVLSGATTNKPTFVPDLLGVYQVQLIVNNGFENSVPASVQVNVTDQAPVANAGPDQTINIGSTVTLNGSGSTDVDGHPLTYQWSIMSAPQGSSATLTNPTSVRPTFVVDRVGNFTVQLIVNDGFLNSQPSKVTISTNDVAPVANAGPDQTVSVGATVQLDGSGSTDVDGNPITYSWLLVSVPQGSSATLSSATAVQPTFVADRVGTYSVQLIVNDGFLNSQPATVTISTNDVPPKAIPIVNPPVVIPGTLVTLDASKSTDSDGLPLSYQWALLTKPSRSAATLSSTNTLTTSFTADLPGNYVVQLIVNDGFLSSSPATALISSNDVPPVANPGPNQTVTAGATVQLDGTGSSSASNFPPTYKWTISSQPTGGSAVLSDPAASKPTFVPNVAGLYVVQLIVNDGFLDSQPQTMKVTANPPNQPPTVSAGPNQTIVLPVNSVTLNGSASSVQPPGSPVAVQWSVSNPPGAAVTLSNPTQPVTQASFPSAGTYVVQLTGTVTATGLSASAQATITVSLPAPPIANSGTNQSVIVNGTVQLDGTASSDPSNLPLTYFWSFASVPSGSGAALTGATTSKPTFVPDLLGVYQVQLVVNNGFENSVPATVQITVTDQAPTANAGPNQTLNIDSTVTLNASGSTDVDGHPLTYQWSITSAPQGSSAVLTNPTSATPTFVVDRVGNFTVQLIVNDGFLNSQPSTVTISTNDVAPVANAGANQTILVGATVQLDGSKSTDVDGNPLTYSWSFVSVPQGSSATLTNATAVQPTFVADRVGAYSVQLIVNDGFLNSPPATVTISTNDVAPVANPGANHTVTAGTVVNLNGSGSTDSDSLPLTYQWALLTKPSGSAATLSSTNTVSTSFTADLPGNYVAQLIVNDGFLNSQPATVMISTNDVAPVANPGPNQTVTAGTTVQLDGTGSTSSLNFPLTYRWAILSQPTGGNAVVSDPAASKPTFVPNVAGLYVVQLIVNDGYLDSQPQTMTVTANPSNQPPAVNAGPNQTVELPVNTATLNGSASSVAPAGSPVTVQWSVVIPSGAAVTFSSPTQPVTQATFPGVGTYQLQLSATVTATGLSNSAQTTVTVVPVNQPPVVSAGPDQTISFPSNTTTLNGTATDDGFPPGSTLAIAWTKLSGPGNILFSNPNKAITPATFSAPGVYFVQLSASDGQYTSTGSAKVTVLAPPGSQGLAVNAGPNQTIVFPASATMAGNVVDSALPAGGTLTIQWTQTSGPGTATFSDPTSPTATVTFSAPGVYDLRLNATDGVLSASSDVLIFVGHVQCTSSSKGTDFWLMFIGAVSILGATPQGERDLFISGDSTTSGVVNVPGIGFTQNFSVTPGQVTKITVPLSAMITTTDTVETKGIHVTAQAPVAVYGLTYIAEASDGFTGLPSTMLGTNYVALGYANTLEVSALSSPTDFGTEFGVTATQDNTTVTITPAASVGPAFARKLGGIPYTVHLNQGQTYQLQNDTDGPSGTGGQYPVDLSGSSITSDKPIAVFGGHDCVSVPTNNAACNHIVEELPPTNLWGQSFVTMPLASQTMGDTFRYLASTDNTHVTVNGTAVATLNRGQFFEQVLTAPSLILADKPLLVAQYSNSNTFSQGKSLTVVNSNLDPSMTLVPPFEQFGGNYTISTPVITFSTPPAHPQTQGFQLNFVNVVAPTSVAQQGGVLLDGAAIPASSFVPIQSSGWSGAQVPVAVGTHNFSSSMPFGVWSYGWDYFDAYSYTGGYCLTSGMQNATLAVTPKNASPQVPQRICLTAAYADKFGNPAGGVGVNFNVSGVNPQSTQVSTDGSGNATFCYSSTATGTDSVTAAAGGLSDTASITWLAAGQNQAPVVNAGANQSIELPTNTVQLNGTATDDGLPIGSTLSFQWSMVSGPASVTFTAPTQLSTAAAFTAPGTYVLQLAANDTQLTGAGTTQITVYPVNQAPVVSAGPDQNIQLPTNTVTLQGTATDDGMPPNSKVTVLWSQVSGPGTATFSAPTQLLTQATFSVAGAYVLKLTASDTLLTSSSTVNVTVQPADPTFVPPQVTAGPSQTIQLPTNTVTLNGTATNNGNPTGTTMTVSWTEISGPGTVTFTTPSQAVTQATFPATGTYFVQISANNGHFTSTAATSVNVLPADVPPVVTAPPPQSIELPQNTVLLNGLVTDNTLPQGATLTVAWSEVSGPAGVTFSAPSSASTLASFSGPGTYGLKLSATDGTLSSSATTNVTVYPVNQPPVVSAGAPQTLIFIPNVQTFVSLNGTASDDGMPPASKLAVAWSELSGQGDVAFMSPQSLTTTATFSNPGTYLLQLSASDGQYTATSTTTVNVIPAVFSAGGPYTAILRQPITVTGTITANGQDITNQFPIQGANLNWQGQNVSFSNVRSATTQATFFATGTQTISLCLFVSNSPCGSTTVVVTSGAPPPPPPSVSISSITDGAEITQPTPIIGSVTSGTWTLDYALQDDFNPLKFTTIATGTTAVNNGTLGTLDPTLLLNGTYVVRLTSVDTTSGQTSSTSFTVSVTRNMKVGVFSLSFNDLTVPVAGIPIQIIRTYDSRDKTPGDFGIGWRLGLANVRLQKNHNMGLNWFETAQVIQGFSQYCLGPANPATVTVVFPDGRTYRFQETTTKPCQNFGPIGFPTVAFTELPGATGTAGAQLVPADGGQTLIDGSVPGPVNLVGFDGSIYNPTSFILTTIDGTKYALDQRLGVTSITDVNGNTITISPNGITGPGGVTVAITRDTLGRVQQITDPDGNATHYVYDDNDNLVSFVDRTGAQTNLNYDGSANNPSNHYLLSILAIPQNQTLLTNTFDSSTNRLTQTTDAIGFPVAFTHNLAAQTETVKDRNGNSTTYFYDNDGNIVQTTDALGSNSFATYDADGNKLTDTNANGKAITYTYDNLDNRLTESDPLGNKTSYTYNSFGKPLTITDPNNHTTTNTYDPTTGNLLTTTDANGNTTTNTYTNKGQLFTTKDPLGNVTTFGYDVIGNLTSQKDAAGTVTSYTYDNAGNRASQSVTRTLSDGVTKQTLTTSYVYDGNGRLTKTTYPDNSTTQTVYNNLGQQITTIDARNFQTTYQYDSDGRILQTSYPDNTTELSIYDHNGNRTQFTQRTGVETSYTYDVLNRLTQRQLNFSSPTINKTSYDAIGQVLTTTDPNNNVTTYAYDDAGRRTTVTDALKHVTTLGYDAAGNQTSVKDANQNVTTYVYDNANRRTQVIYPDNKIDATAYDALGRVTSRTDANGKIMQYGYDVLGRLTSVVQDAVSGGLNLLTQYGYDEVGNRITQTDASNHTTSYAYDKRGRRVQRTLPLGQSESYTYDAAGNVLTRTDFNGKTTTYAYNNANQLLSKKPDPSFNAPTVTYTYSQTQRVSMTDVTGTTNWGYDTNGNITSVSNAEGRLDKTYDAAGNLKQTLAQPTISTVNYTYDALNRLATVQESKTGTTTYGYDNVGNLQSATTPNGVVHSYTYDTRNRLTNLGVNKAATAIASYAYTLDAAGHRTGVTELSGRTVSYGYDSIYRLTSETIAGDPNNVNGSASYVYDPVGNRTQKTSTIPGFPGGLTNYNANDQLATDTYDNDGNTTASNGLGFAYDFENHVIQAGSGITMAYDGDGNRVSKTVAGVKTTYLVDPANPTGYAQVVQENFSGSFSANRESSRVFVYGLERINQLRQFLANGQNQTQTSYYAYDGHGSTRALSDPNGAVTDTYDYDAFGNIVHSTATGIPPGGTTIAPTPNEFLFAGEQFDSDLNLYYNRARYLNVSTGRFWTMDTEEGNDEEPLSLHKYLYAGNDAINQSDPSGHDLTVGEVLAAVNIGLAITNAAGAVIHAYNAITASSPDEAHAETIAVWEDVAGTVVALLGAGGGSLGPRFAIAGGLSEAAVYAEETVTAAQRAAAAAASFIFFAVATQGPSSSGTSNVTVRQNYSSGTQAAQKFFDDLEQRGIEVVARDGVHIDTPLGERVPDGIIRVNGKLIGIEVKSGNASRSALQGAKDMWININGGKAFGAKAAKAGIQRIEGMRTFFVP